MSTRFIFSGGKKSVVVKGKKAASEQKQCQTNNKLFLSAVHCFKAGKFNYKPKSKKCAVCKDFIQPKG